MPISDDQVAALRAHLSGDYQEYHEIWRQLDREAAKVGYSSLIAAAFFNAVDRHFNKKTTTENDVIEYIASARSRFDPTGEDVDPRAAETMIWTVLGKEPDSDFDDATVAGAQFVMLTALIKDEQFTDRELDAFLADARKIADEWIAEDLD